MTLSVDRFSLSAVSDRPRPSLQTAARGASSQPGAATLQAALEQEQAGSEQLEKALPVVEASQQSATPALAGHVSKPEESPADTDISSTDSKLLTEQVRQALANKH